MSVVPLIPLRRVDDLIERLEATKRDAEARGFGTLAYFLETALIEARIQHKHLEGERAGANARPEALWRPTV